MVINKVYRIHTTQAGGGYVAGAKFRKDGIFDSMEEAVTGLQDLALPREYGHFEIIEYELRPTGVKLSFTGITEE